MRDTALLNWQEAIRDYLARENISHSELSNRTGIPETRISGWLRKQPYTKSPTWEDVVILTNKVDINPFLALYGIEESEEIRQLKKAIETLTNENDKLRITVQTLRKMDDEIAQTPKGE